MSTTAAAVDLKAISERYFAAWADRDPDAIVALHTDDTQFWTHLGGDPVLGRDAVRATFAELFNGFPVMVSPDGLVARKDTFVDGVQMQAAMGVAAP